MRILILHSRYLSGNASGENQVVNDQALALRRAGHEVWLLSPEPDVGDAAARGRQAASAVWSRAAARRVARAVRGGHMDVVHAHNVYPTLSPAVLRAARQAGAAVVMTLHNYRLMCLPGDFLRDARTCEDCLGHVPWPGVRHSCYRDSLVGSTVMAASITLHRAIGTFDQVTRYLAVSAFVRSKHIEAGIDGDRILVVPNFVEAMPRRSGTGDYFLFAGRLAPEKGSDLLLEAWRSSSPPGTLRVAGDGPQRTLFERRTAGVEFLGPVERSTVRGLLQGARALLVPSRFYEGLPTIVLEAYAAGVPVIASSVGALAEIVIPDQTGLLVPPDDPQAIRAAAIRLLDDSSNARLGENAVNAWFERYSPARGVAALVSAYEHSLAVAQLPPGSGR